VIGDRLQGNYQIEHCKKIITTTDQDLIKEGIQAISDEFLEFIVKNPSSEFVKVDREYSCPVMNKTYDKPYINYKIIIPQQEVVSDYDIIVRNPIYGKKVGKSFKLKAKQITSIDGDDIPKQEYEYIGECNGNNGNGCFMNSSGHDCGCFIKKPKQDKIMERFIANAKQQETLEEAAKNYMSQFINVQDAFAKEDFINGAKWQQEQILDFLFSEITEQRDYTSSKMCEKVIEFIEQFKNK
jgi:hypothetical protein